LIAQMLGHFIKNVCDIPAEFSHSYDAGQRDECDEHRVFDHRRTTPPSSDFFG
jgi:hypothetical protein